MSEPTVADRTSTPAVALGPSAIVLGTIAALIAWMPQPPFSTLLCAAVVAALAVGLGAAGIHHARRGTGRLWAAIAGTTLGTVGLAIALNVMWALNS